MLYFIYKGAYCSAEEINEQMEQEVQYITENEYNFWLENQQEENTEEEE